MSIKIAAFNIENIFDRASAFDQPTAEAQEIIDAVADLNKLFETKVYNPMPWA